VSASLTTSHTPPVPARRRLLRRRPQADDAAWLARADRLASQRAELHYMHDLLEDAATVVALGWVQHGWFAVLDERGHRTTLTAQSIRLADERPLVGACLVGAVVHAAGGPSQVHTQLLQRTLDLTWHTLHGNPRQPVRWCPGPEVRAAHLRDLTRWNDAPGRSATQVTALLRAAQGTVATQRSLLDAR
jgi:hypothetical protein